MFPKKIKVPKHLRLNGRVEDQHFKLTDKLYRSFDLDDYDETEDTIKTESIRRSDLSCNWDKYSIPSDIQYIENGSPYAGCYSLTVEVSKYKNIAMPVHVPREHDIYPNYSHAEIRACLATEEDAKKEGIPHGGRKFRKSMQLDYRQNIANKSIIEFMARH